MLELSIGEKSLTDRDLAAIEMDGGRVADAASAVLDGIADELDRVDPDVLRLNTSQLVPLLYEAAGDRGADWFDLGRLPGYQQLAGESVFESYGVIGHSPARFNVPGQAIIDESNSFLWNKAGLQGLLDLTERSWKPLQESGWASIGNLLTAIQIREAFQHRDVLIPWNKFQPEFRKDVETLHAADRGGFIFDPQVGLFEDVHELDFSSLYPNIMIEYNVSPDTVLCECHPERTVVPELGYNICEERGLIPDVLEPIVEDRDRIKSAIAETDDLDRRHRSSRNRQRSTPPFIEAVQHELMEVLDRHREPEPVCDRLQVHLSRLRAGDVNPQELVFRKRVSKRLEAYTQGTHTVSALMRYRDHGIEKNPGQDVRYVVVEDNARQSERVRLHFELNDEYDGLVYERELMRAAESIISPLGWDRGDIRRYVKGTRETSIRAYE